MLQGLLYDSNRTTLHIEFKACDEKKEERLQPGESCMGEEEFNEYFREK